MLRNPLNQLAIGLVFLIAAGCNGQSSPTPAKAAVTLANATCPITGNPASASVTTVWNGKNVGFCCGDCLPAWNDLSDDEKSASLAADPAEAGHDGHAHGSSTAER